MNELPGTILTRQDQLAPAILNTKNFVWTDEWEAFRQRFAPLEDGKAADRVIQALFKEG